MGFGRGKQEQPWNRKGRFLRLKPKQQATEQQASMADWQKTAAAERQKAAAEQEFQSRRRGLAQKALERPKVAERLGRQMQRLKGGGRGGFNINQPRDEQGKWT